MQQCYVFFSLQVFYLLNSMKFGIFFIRTKITLTIQSQKFMSFSFLFIYYKVTDRLELRNIKDLA